MNQRRRALLLAISEYEPVDPLPYVRGDVPRMQRALELMGVAPGKIEAHGFGIEGSPDLSTGRLRTFIQRFLTNAVAGEDLIIYFSGHGIEQEGHRLLVPQDYDREFPPRASEMVSDVDLFSWSRRSKAASVLVLIDACREGVKLEPAPDEDDTKSLKAAVPRPTAKGADDTPTVAIVFSCSSGQASGRDIKGECSAFTRAFAETLEAESEVGKLMDVIAEAQNRLDAVAVVAQTITLGDLRSYGRKGDAEALIVKASPAAQFRDRLENSAWVQRLKDLKPWQTVHAAAPALATQVATITLRAEELVGKASSILPQQRWRVRDAPFRMLERINDHLVSRVKVEPAELALLLAVPFAYEVVLASAEIALAAQGLVLDPLSTEEFTGASRFWRAWRLACLNDEAAHRQIQRLKEGDETEAAEDVAAWRLSAFCHRAGELWDPVDATTPHSGWVADEVTNVVALVPLEEVRSDPRVPAILTSRRLLRLARLMFAAFEDVTFDPSGQLESSLDDDLRFGEGAAELRLNEIKTVHLLNIGARLSLDARRLPPVLAEHLGSDDRLTLRAVQDLLSISAWHMRDEALALDLTCPHEALDAALRETVDDLDTYRRHIFSIDVRQRHALEGLPATFNANDLKPEIYQGRPRYNPEHLRFALDQPRVMNLLMGKELYGDPDLALRELYQNALDACRYRRAHETYIRKTQANPIYGPDYRGRIMFRFATEDGRRVIECLDNGIGMAQRHLRRLFARAGQRFTDSHEYHLDKARWETAGINFFPNSRFGIGVLSYFMLAEEMEVESQRVTLPNMPVPERIHARVLSSGSLFRIDQETSGAVQNGGTRVRLYLEDRLRPLRHYYDSIMAWLWLPEFLTVLELDNVHVTELLAGRPAQRFEESLGPLIPVRGSEGSDGTARIFWCLTDRRTQPSALLVDGILNNEPTVPAERPRPLTRLQRRAAPRSALSTPPRTAINLTEELRPELSVNRNAILSANSGLDFLKRCIQNGGWRSLTDWQNPQLKIFLQLFRPFPIVMFDFSNALRSGEVTAPNIATGAPQISLPSAAGVCDIDEILFENLDDDTGDLNLFDISEVPAGWSRLYSLRLSELVKTGVRLPPLPTLLARYAEHAFGGQCPALSATLFRRGSEPGWRSITDLIQTAQDLELSLSQIVDLASPLAAVGLHIPALAQLKNAPLSKMQLCLLSEELDGEYPFVNSLNNAHLSYAAKILKKSITEIKEIARSLAIYGINIPDLGYDVALTEEQLWLLSENIDGEPPFISTFNVGHLLYAATKGGKSLSEIVNIAQSLTHFGVRVPNLHLIESSRPPSQQELILLSEGLDGTSPFLDTISVGHLFYASKKVPMSLEEICEAAQALERFEITVPNILQFINVFSFAEDMTVLLSEDLDGRPPFVDALSADHLIDAAVKLKKNITQLMELTRPLSEMGIVVADISILEPKQHEAIALREKLNESGNDPPSATDLRDAAEELHMSMREIAGLTRSFVSAKISIAEFDILDLAHEAQSDNVPLNKLVRDLKPILTNFPEYKERFSRIQLSDATKVLALRAYLKDDDGETRESRSLSFWDLAGAAEELNVPVFSLASELDKLEALDIDTTDCRKFIEFCMIQEQVVAL
jgi:caspase domain-containing protein